MESYNIATPLPRVWNPSPNPTSPQPKTDIVTKGLYTLHLDPQLNGTVHTKILLHSAHVKLSTSLHTTLCRKHFGSTTHSCILSTDALTPFHVDDYSDVQISNNTAPSKNIKQIDILDHHFLLAHKKITDTCRPHRQSPVLSTSRTLQRITYPQHFII